MYVEISPRQSGKTTRLVNAAVDYLRNNTEHKIAVVGLHTGCTKNIQRMIREKLALNCSLEYGLEWPDELIYRMVDNVYMSRISLRHSLKLNRGQMDPDFWFLDEFGYFPSDFFDSTTYRYPSYYGLPLNAYYCTTPNGNTDVTLRLIEWCRDNNHTIHFHNPWTESRIQEQYGFDAYIRREVLDSWVDFMTGHGFPIRGLKENWLTKFLKPHNFLNGK